MPHLLISSPPQYCHTLFTYYSNSQQTTPSSLLTPPTTLPVPHPFHLWPPPPPLCYLQYTTFPLWSHTVSTYTTPISILPRPQLYLCHTFFIFCPSPILSIPQLLLTWHTTPSSHLLHLHTLFTGIVNLLKMLLCFLLFIHLFWPCYWKLIMKSIEGL